MLSFKVLCQYHTTNEVEIIMILFQMPCKGISLLSKVDIRWSSSNGASFIENICRLRITNFMLSMAISLEKFMSIEEIELGQEPDL